MNAGIHYMLDTNTIAYMLSGRSPAARLMLATQLGNAVISISAITEAETLYGLAKKPEAIRLRASVEELFAVLRILPWDSAAAKAHGTLRASISAAGKALSSTDMLIAAHAVASSANFGYQ